MGVGAAPIHRIVLTGGPCGGKSTALAHISDRLRSLGFRVFCAPEAATLLIGGGATPLGLEPEALVRFQACLIRLMMTLEDTFLELARQANGPAVVICDRGACLCRSVERI